MANKIFCMAIGVGTKKNSNNEWLEVYYPMPILNPNINIVTTIEKLLKIKPGCNVSFELNSQDCHALEDMFIDIDQDHLAKFMLILENSNCSRVLTILYKDSQPESVPEAYLKLQLLSNRLVKPHKLNLTGIFSILPTVAWTSKGAIAPEDLPTERLIARQKGTPIQVFSIDKFPRMADYVVPSEVRIADTARVRLGAYIGAGTTIMHEGFINFNAGTMGASMIEGRVSSGIVVGSGSDLGGGCSTMGTLSGGNNLLVSIGKNCLIGANAGVGISLGDNCTIEAGLYITGSSKVQMLVKIAGIKEDIVKANKLSGKSNLIFRRNSILGRIECLRNDKSVKLNDQLHNNN